jgi:phosphate transport system substrate-binding protein
MSDEFLYRMRREPPAEFAARLKRRLERQAAGRPPRASSLRLLIVALLLGATAFAVATITMRGVPLVIVQLLRGPQPAGHVNGAVVAHPSPRPRDAWTLRRVAPDEHAATAPSPGSTTAEGSASRPGLATGSVETRDAEAGRPAGIGTQASIRIAASPLAYPFALVIAGDLARSREKDADLPRVDRYPGSGSALLALCDNSDGSPDVALTSERMTAGSLLRCTQNRLGVVEVKLGYEALVLARSVAAGAASGAPPEVSPAQLYTALTSLNSTWNQIDPTLGRELIEIVGPPITALLSDRITELLLLPGCRSSAWAAASNGSSVPAAPCRTSLGQYAEKESVLEALAANPAALGILDYTTYARNADRLIATPLQSVRPSYDSIASGAYPGSRTIYLYLKKNPVFGIARLRPIVELAVSDALVGPAGDLTGLGLIPLQFPERFSVRSDALTLRDLKL